jgi:hypothetical protein
MPEAPTIIHKGTELTAAMTQNLPPDWITQASSKAYMTEDGMTETLKAFHKTLPQHVRPQFLLMDGYVNHFVQYLLVLEDDQVYVIFGASHSSIWAQVNKPPLALERVFE